jgi:hypothetical protein
MQIQLIPVQQPIAVDQLQMMLNSGWRLLGAQTVDFGQPKIAIPGAPQRLTGIQPVQIWGQPEPTIPQAILAGLLVKMYDDGRDGELLHDLSRLLFGRGIVLIKKDLENAMKEPESAG